MSQRVLSLGVLLVSACVLSAGCFFGGPARVHPPSMSPSAAGAGAMEKYDTNKDGVVKGDELEKAPTLKAGLEKLDTNGDGGVSADEVAARIQTWLDDKMGRMAVPCRVTVNQVPLAGAKVTFEPEPFLGSEAKVCVGTTDESGFANVVAQEDNADGTIGCPPGYYLVRVSKEEGGRETIPATYNTNTVIGKEIALDATEMREGSLEVNLTIP